MNKNSPILAIVLFISGVLTASNYYRYIKSKTVCTFNSAVPVVCRFWPPRVEMCTVTYLGIMITECEGAHL